MWNHSWDSSLASDCYSQPIQSTLLSIISQKTDSKADILQHQANGTSDIIQDALKVDDADGDGGDAGLPCVTEQALRS